MVHRIYTERKEPDTSLLNEIRDITGLSFERVRVLNRYDIEGLNDSQLNECRTSIFAEPFTDNTFDTLPEDADEVIAVEYLPGQFDQRAEAAEQCALLLLGFRPTVRTAKVYLFYGRTPNLEAVKKFLINPVEAREAQLDEYTTLETEYPVAPDIETVDDVMSVEGLAMSREDLECVKKYFDSEGRKPTWTEIKVLDTYWSDHCRHTTFTTELDSVKIEDEKVKAAYEQYLTLRKKLNYPASSPVTLMDIATIGAKYLKSVGKFPACYPSEENNACTVRIDVDGESWLLMFKNETHNHPTEIEPFGGAATCIGGAIRDPLAGRGYVYQAMRLTGAASPFTPTITGKLPQRVITTKAAQGYSSYGNQIGIPTGLVHEVYHEGYRAKRLEIGAVIAAVREADVISREPKPGDVVLLLGGRTGRDGIGGATGSSISHTSRSIETCGAEVQKGNAPEERKLQRLFRNPEFTRLIKRCNDFGAGGVSVAVGELQISMDIDLDAVPLKYAGLDGTEIALSESQERMAVVISPENVGRLKELALSEDVEATIIASVTDSERLRMTWRGREVVNIKRAFINTNGASRHTGLEVKTPLPITPTSAKFPDSLADMNNSSQRGLIERFDSTVGALSVTMPFGGITQKTPALAMSAKIPVPTGTETCSLMSWGLDPYVTERSAFDGGYFAVLDALSKVMASGGNLSQCWLSLQEFFPSQSLSKCLSALLGALSAQLAFSTPAIGGKDSMSGTFITDDGTRLDVPPSLAAFAVSVSSARRVISPEFKQSGSKVILLEPDYDSRGLPVTESMLRIFDIIRSLNISRKILACSVLTDADILSEIFRMCLGNNLGFKFDRPVDSAKRYSFIAEVSEDTDFETLGHVISEPVIIFDGQTVALKDAENIYNAPLSEIFPTETDENLSFPNVKIRADLPKTVWTHSPLSSPKFLIPVFTGSNCEYETAKSIINAGGRAEIFLVRSSTPSLMKDDTLRFSDTLRKSHALVIPGGFSNADEPDGSGKFIAIFLRSPEVRASLEELLNERGGLVCGICNGFQALIKTGLLPHGKFTAPENLTSTLTFNRIGRHQSRIIRSLVVSNNSAWLSGMKVGSVYSIPISHGEGRFVCSEQEYIRLMSNGQIAGQYCDEEGRPSMLTRHNPSGSCYAVECLTSPDGRIIGRMGHVERTGRDLYMNVPGDYGAGEKFFSSACNYFRKI